jgi:carboxyl-terminal processing protease
MRRYRQYTLITLIIFISASSVWQANGQTDRAELYESLRRFNNIVNLVGKRYVQDVDPASLIDNALKAMLSSLDPYSVYMDKKAYDRLMVRTKGNYGGLGMLIGMVEGWVTVISPFEGTPAWKAGLKPGDRVTKIDGASTKGITVDEASNKMRGTPGTEVTITIVREGVTEPIEYMLERADIKIDPIPYHGILDKNIGYIKLSNFSEDATIELSKALKDLKKRGAHKFILDLRNNAGGLLSEAVKVADNFLDKNQLIVSTKGRLPYANKEFLAASKSKYGKYPLIVLVNRGSASASEIVAGAIQDWDKGLILGDTTFGKGLVQTLIPFRDSTALKLTTARYYTPSGRCIDKTDTTQFLLRNPTLGGEYYTLGDLKREMRGAGSIIPDMILPSPEKIAPLVVKITAKGLFMEYASKYVGEHQDNEKDFEIQAKDLDDFKAFLESKEFEFEEDGFDEAKGAISRMIKESVAENLWGMRERNELSLKYDPWVNEAMQILGTASSLSDLFALLEESK